MHELSRTVSDIESIFSLNREPPMAEVISLNDRYIEETERANERLRNCDMSLRAGNRVEAIRQCEAEPNLLELVSQLDFPGRESWIDYILRLDMPIPPELLLDIAGELNTSFADVAPLDNLLRYHRQLALARAPLAKRIDIMRRLASLDSVNRFWDKDIRSFEKTRHEQLSKAISAAHRDGDISTLDALEREVRSPEWREVPPKWIVDRATQLHTEVRIDQARKQLEEIEQSLTQAYADFDVTSAKHLRDLWNAKAAIGITDDNDPLVDQVAPALQWIEEQERSEQDEAEYNSALDELEYALDEEEDKGTLERLYHALVRCDRGVPETLQRRLEERIRACDVAAVRRGRLLISLIVVVGILIGCGTGYGIYSHVRAKKATQVVDALAQLIQTGRFPGAEDMLTRIESGEKYIADDPRITELREELTEATRKQNLRLAQFASLLDEAKSNGIDNDDFVTFPVARELLVKASELAQSPSDKNEVDSLRRKIESHELDMQTVVDKHFQADLEVLIQKMKGISGDDLAMTDLAYVDQLVEDLESLKRRRWVSLLPRSFVPPLIKKLASLRARIEAERDEATLLAAIEREAGNPERFVAAMEAFVNEFPLAPQAASFKQVLAEEPKLWKGLEAWNSVVELWAKRNLTQLTPESASLMLESAEKMLTTYPGYPAAKHLGELTPYLKAVSVRADPSRESPRTNLSGLLNNPIVRTPVMFASKGGKRYYLKDAPRRLKGHTSWNVYYYDDLRLVSTRAVKLTPILADNPQKEKPYADNAAPMYENDPFDWTSPQASFVSLERLDDYNKKEWESTYFALISHLHKDRRMDPILKLHMLKEVIQAACEGSHCMKLAYETNLATLASPSFDISVNWIDPNNEDGNRMRSIANRLLLQLTLNEAVKQAGKLYSLLKRPNLGATYHRFGYLRRDNAQRWICSGKTSSTKQTLVTIYPAPGDGLPTVSVIGVVSAEGVKLDESNARAFVEGRSVFLVKENRITMPQHVKKSESSE